jgi:hypothetical protein
LGAGAASGGGLRTAVDTLQRRSIVVVGLHSRFLVHSVWVILCTRRFHIVAGQIRGYVSDDKYMLVREQGLVWQWNSSYVQAISFA